MKHLRKIGLLAAIAAMSAPVVLASPTPAANKMLDRVIDHCVDRIGGQANYVDGVRVVHRVVSTREVGLAEWQFRIDTIVMADEESAVLRAYSSTCTTMGADTVVRFRMNETDAG
jgi:hypothetical protein